MLEASLAFLLPFVHPPCPWVEILENIDARACPVLHAKWSANLKNSFSRALHGNLHVNKFGFCVTAPNPIRLLI